MEILKANQFNSGLTKDAFAKIQIEFDTLQKPCFFEKVTNTLKAERSSRDKFFICFIEEQITKARLVCEA